MRRFYALLLCVALTGPGWMVGLRPVHAGDLSFQFNFDSSFVNNAGSNLAAAESDFAYVGNYIASVVKPSFAGNAVIRVDVNGENNPTSGFLASASGLYYTNDAFNKSLAQLAVQDNFVDPGGSPEGISTINFSWAWGYGGNVAPNQLDFRWVLLHELFHVMGFESWISSTGSSYLNNVYSYYDQYVQGWDGSKYVNLVTRDASNTPTGVMANAANAVIDNAHPLLFNGPNVNAYLGQGAELYTPSVFADGSSVSHYNYPGQLEYFQIAGWGPLYTGFSGLDIAFLKDLGYNVVPEPHTYIMGTAGLVALVVSRRKLRKS